MDTNIENNDYNENEWEKIERERKEYDNKIISLIPEFKKLSNFKDKLDFKEKHSFDFVTGKVAISIEDMENGNCLDFTPDK